jgi:hypothetical protein
MLRAIALTNEGCGVKEAAESVGVTERRLAAAVQSEDSLGFVLGESEAKAKPNDVTRRRNLVGQLIVGRAAEVVFEEIYQRELGSSEFTIADHRLSRSETDYRMLDGSQRPVYRLNIKFFGSLFRAAQQYVKLDPEDCFPLATYKIRAALNKQHEENLAYIFVVVGVPGLTGKSVAEQFTPLEIDPLMHLLLSRKVEGKRDLEDRFVEWQVGKRHLAFSVAYDQIKLANWYVLSARKADKLLRENLFERVFAVGLPRFTRAFPNAELDMHYSLKGDLKELTDFFRVLRAGGVQLASSMLERGDL